MNTSNALKPGLNLISTVATIRCGNTFGDLTIELQPSSAKLLFTNPVRTTTYNGHHLQWALRLLK